MSDSKAVLFVCMGNICRSPTGEGVMRAVVEERGLSDQIEIDSAGTISYHTGDNPDPRMCSAASARGYDLQGPARQICDEDFDRFDLIVAMDRENLRDIQGRRPGDPGQVQLLSAFLPEGHDYSDDVPDPYYGGAKGFERVLDMIEAACPRIADYLTQGKE